MRVRAGDNGTDWNLPVGDVEVQFVAAPILLVTFGRCLYSDRALHWQPGNHPVQCQVALPFNLRAALGRFTRLVLIGFLLLCF